MTQTQTEPVQIDIVQVLTGGISGTTEHRTLDYVEREHSDHIFGRLNGRSRFLPLADITDDFLKTGWEEAIKETGTIQAVVKSIDSDWAAEQIWGFEVVDGERRYVRHVVLTNDKGERKQARLVYDFYEERK